MKEHSPKETYAEAIRGLKDAKANLIQLSEANPEVASALEAYFEAQRNEETARIGIKADFSERFHSLTTTRMTMVENKLMKPSEFVDTTAQTVEELLKSV